MKTTIKVTGMHCKSCEVLLTDAIGEIPGTSEVQVNHKEGRVNLSCADEDTLQNVKATIIKEGYQVVE